MGIVKESLDDVNTVLKEDPDNHQVCATSHFDGSLLPFSSVYNRRRASLTDPVNEIQR